MNKIQCKLKLSEIISLDKIDEIRQNGVLSQKQKAVTPNRQNWLFLRPNTAQHGIGSGVNLPYTDHHTAKSGLVRFPLMVWLILQNKPLGEYAERLLFVPRVRPHRLFLGLSTQKQRRVFQ
ncbi:hypothetical protein [Moraxella catarrhalis]|uniref:hypothetical protein n=1 Tax=Moraxella catarrhalis TaxID=480 RepID=UPI0007E38569|nr:hypothetical protein [Moraxella catarrhalis]OAV05138.1 hypothetical protein AO381_0496 [Moraxella catarrhalis]